MQAATRSTRRTTSWRASTALPTFASPPYYLSLQVNGEYLVPRLKLASVPSAIQAATSDLLPFAGTYSGTNDAFNIQATSTSGAEGLRVDRSSGTSGATAFYASNYGPGIVFRGFQNTSTATTTAPVLDLDIGNSNNDSPVVNAQTTGAGPAYYGASDGVYGLEVYTDASDDNVTHDDAHVVHAVYDGGVRDANNVAVYGEALDDFYGIGGQFWGSAYGVVGMGVAPSSGGDVVGVYGAAVAGNAADDNIGVLGYAAYGGTNYAGLFDGNVDVDGTLSKNAGSFKIDHPLAPANKYLSHSFVESSDMMNIYNGNVELDGSGEAWVEFPEWFEALNQDFRYQLTCVGAFAPVYVADGVSGNRFHIAGGTPDLIISWQVTGIRYDPYADAHRIPVEEMKSAREQGRYRNPELYGMPESAGVHYDERVAKSAARETARGHRKAEPEAPEGVDPANQ